ncbi:PA14 domain-containing protein [Raineyella fluvialis]|uniref:PA14 domain-containing protein n=1 Tax=Raineyella fluvialis TaxID=2662261 RepID=A0A5Q2FDT0_9ACTN|nr:PA14 domain-containing protein [Raineyella fluvialis]QGF23604.1 hypothetical protein Rai3103_07920 [Raineyella fluvialis]
MAPGEGSVGPRTHGQEGWSTNGRFGHRPNGVKSATDTASWTSSPVVSGSDYWGVRMIGKLYLPTSGSWGVRVVSDGGVRVSIDDTVVIDDWTDGPSRSHPAYSLNNTTTAGVPHRLSIDYYHLGGATADFTLFMTPAGGRRRLMSRSTSSPAMVSRPVPPPTMRRRAT